MTRRFQDERLIDGSRRFLWALMHSPDSRYVSEGIFRKESSERVAASLTFFQYNTVRLQSLKYLTLVRGEGLGNFDAQSTSSSRSTDDRRIACSGLVDP